MTQVHSGSNELPLLSPGWELVDTLPEHQQDDADEWEEDEVGELACITSIVMFKLSAQVSYLVLDSGSKLRSAELLALNEIQISVRGPCLCHSEIPTENDARVQELESERPIIRLGPHIFEARYENLLGSELILSEETSQSFCS